MARTVAQGIRAQHAAAAAAVRLRDVVARGRAPAQGGGTRHLESEMELVYEMRENH